VVVVNFNKRRGPGRMTFVSESTSRQSSYFNLGEEMRKQQQQIKVTLIKLSKATQNKKEGEKSK